MNFEYKTKTEDGIAVTLVFKPFGDAPGRIPRWNIGNMEAQVWGYLEWGLLEPAVWPADSKLPGKGVFDVIPQREITRCYNKWQAGAVAEEDEDKKAPVPEDGGS